MFCLKSCNVADKCWQKNWREFGSILQLPHCYFWRGCWKTCFFPLFCNNCWKQKKCNVWVISAFFLKVAMLLTNVGKKLARVWFHASPATLLLLKGMLKDMFFPTVLQQLLKTKKMQCLGHKCFFLKSCDVADKCWQKIGESLVPCFTCHTATFEGDVEKHVFSHCFATTAERKKNAVTLLHRHSLLQQLLWKEKKCCDTLTASPPFCNNCCERKKMLWHSYSVTPILQQLLKGKKCCDTLTASLPLNWMAMTCASSTQLHFQQEPHFQWVPWPFNSNPTITSPKIWQERKMGLYYLSVVVRISAHPHFSGRPICLSCQILIYSRPCRPMAAWKVRSLGLKQICEKFCHAKIWCLYFY